MYQKKEREREREKKRQNKINLGKKKQERKKPKCDQINDKFMHNRNQNQFEFIQREIIAES